MHLEATLAGMTDDVAMIDADMRLVEWNPGFPELVGIPGAMLRVGLPLQDIIRAQVAAGVFGDVEVETEVTRRIADLRNGRHHRAHTAGRPGGGCGATGCPTAAISRFTPTSPSDGNR